MNVTKSLRGDIVYSRATANLISRSALAVSGWADLRKSFMQEPTWHQGHEAMAHIGRRRGGRLEVAGRKHGVAHARGRLVGDCAVGNEDFRPRCCGSRRRRACAPLASRTTYPRGTSSARQGAGKRRDASVTSSALNLTRVSEYPLD